MQELPKEYAPKIRLLLEASRPLDIWVLADDKVGTTNQAIGVAQKLGGNISIVRLEDLEQGKLAQFLEQQKSQNRSTRRWPDVLISASPNTEDMAGELKRLAGNRIFNVKLGPINKENYGDFDLIARYDPPGYRSIPTSAKDKTIFTEGVAHKVTPDAIKEGAKLWEEKFSLLPRPRIAVLVGGNTSPYHAFTPAMAEEFGRDVSKMAERLGGSLIVTNSKRTPSLSTEALFKNITVPSYLHDTHRGGENPYFGMLGIADGIVASGDSMSMVEEACSTGKPVYYYPMPKIEMPYDMYFQQKLTQEGQARPFNGKLEHWTYTPHDVAGQVVDEIRTRLQQKALSR